MVISKAAISWGLAILGCVAGKVVNILLTMAIFGYGNCRIWRYLKTGVRGVMMTKSRNMANLGF